MTSARTSAMSAFRLILYWKSLDFFYAFAKELGGEQWHNVPDPLGRTSASDKGKTGPALKRLMGRGYLAAVLRAGRGRRRSLEGKTRMKKMIAASLLVAGSMLMATQGWYAQDDKAGGPDVKPSSQFLANAQ